MRPTNRFSRPSREGIAEKLMDSKSCRNQTNCQRAASVYLDCKRSAIIGSHPLIDLPE